MEWTDQGIILSLRPHGEDSFVVHLLTQEHGKYAGYIKSGKSKKDMALYQEGNLVQATWKSRLEDQLGFYHFELLKNFSAPILHDPVKLSALTSACALSDAFLYERHLYPDIYFGLEALLTLLSDANSDFEFLWQAVYIKWECALLAALGFGMSFSECAVCQKTDTLSHISPKTGKIVCEEHAQPYLDKLIICPDFLKQSGEIELDKHQIKMGLELTHYFMEKHLAPHLKSGLPMARHRLYNYTKFNMK